MFVNFFFISQYIVLKHNLEMLVSTLIIILDFFRFYTPSVETIPCLVFRQQDFRCGYDDGAAAIGPPDIRAWKNHHTKAHVILLYSLDQCHLYPIPFSSSPFTILLVTYYVFYGRTLFNPICLPQLADHRTIVQPLSSYRVYSEKKNVLESSIRMFLLVIDQDFKSQVFNFGSAVLSYVISVGVIFFSVPTSTL